MFPGAKWSTWQPIHHRTPWLFQSQAPEIFRDLTVTHSETREWSHHSIILLLSALTLLMRICKGKVNRRNVVVLLELVSPNYQHCWKCKRYGYLASRPEKSWISNTIPRCVFKVWFANNFLLSPPYMLLWRELHSQDNSCTTRAFDCS